MSNIIEFPNRGHTSGRIVIDGVVWYVYECCYIHEGACNSFWMWARTLEDARARLANIAMTGYVKRRTSSDPEPDGIS